MHDHDYGLLAVSLRKISYDSYTRDVWKSEKPNRFPLDSFRINKFIKCLPAGSQGRSPDQTCQWQTKRLTQSGYGDARMEAGGQQ